MKIINVANRLPVTIQNTDIKPSGGGLAAALKGARRDRETMWVGWPGAEISKTERSSVEKKLRDELGCIAVFLDKEDRDGYYDGFSNSSLWPLLHYMSDYMDYTDGWFDAYRRVNGMFADAVLAEASAGDLVWVHDYHLFLLPEMLKKRRPELKIGFFLHTPFPSYELFRCHPRRQELLRGLLGADLIGFHTFGYLRHFRSALLRILGVESNLNQVVYNGWSKRLGVFPIGIDSARFEQTMESQSFADHLRQLNEEYYGKKVVLSVERLDYSKGIPKKLQAIEMFLEQHPERKEDTVFILIAVPSREEVDSYRDLKETVELSVGHINGQYATLRNIPVNFINRAVPFHELAALYARADIALVTPLIDGMNLVAKEYLVCQTDGDGVLILSEFAGAAQELFSAVLVNPYDVDRVARAIDAALTMSPEERRFRLLPMRTRVVVYNADHWARDFIDTLDGPSEPAQSTADFRIFSGEVLDAFRDATHQKTLFLDYDGTLREFERNPEDAVPSAHLLSIFDRFSKRSDFRIVIVSGRDAGFLEQHFGRYDFTLVGEHGYVVKKPGKGWNELNPDADLSWKDQVENIFQLYALSTPGSAVEVKRSAIVWHYRKADPEFGIWKANHLLGELTESISNLPVEIHHGKRIVEVSSQQISKGFAVEKLLKENDSDGGPAVCIGDDQTDETMLQLKKDNLFTIKVGGGTTAAAYRIPAPKQVRDFLEDLLTSQEGLPTE